MSSRPVNFYFNTSYNSSNIQIAGKQHKKVLVLDGDNQRVYKLPHREAVVRVMWNTSNGFETEDKLGVIRRFCLQTGETSVVFKPNSLLSKEEKRVAPCYRKIDPSDIVEPVPISAKASAETTEKSMVLPLFTAKVIVESNQRSDDVACCALPIINLNGLIFSHLKSATSLK